MSSLLTLKVVVVVVRGGRDDEGNGKAFYFIFKTGLMPRILVNKLSHGTILLDKKTPWYC